MGMPKILLVDDEADFIENIAELLRHRGFETSIANNGEEGLRLIKEHAFDVVVLDLRMPGISGLDVLGEIKPEHKNAPEVIILTGFGTVDSGIEGLNLGAFDYVMKPVKIGELVARISAALERKIRKGSY